MPSEAIRFLQQWRKLDESEPRHTDRNHDLYVGHEPIWEDIRRGLAFRRGLEDAAMRELLPSSSSKAGEDAIITVYGESFSGKSVWLLSLGQRLLESGYDPYLLRSDEALDKDAVVWWIQRNPRTVLLIDQGRDWAKDIKPLSEATSTQPTSMRLVLIDRMGADEHVEKQLISVPHARRQLSGRLSTVEVDRLIRKLSDKKRLGELTLKNKQERIAYFEQRGRQIFSSMAELERGRGFIARVVEEYEAVRDPSSKRLLNAAALVGKLGYRVPLKATKGVSGLAVGDVRRQLASEPLSDLLVVRSSGVAARHRFFAELVYDECMSLEVRGKAGHEVAEALAPHVSPTSISAATLDYRIVRALMGSSFVRDMTGSPEEALRWYGSLQETYDWNARYWEQRALAATDANLYEKAFSWASQAVARRSDAFSLNTVGVVLMRRALYEARSGWPADSFESAEKALSQARDLERENAEYPFDTFFRYTIRLMEAVPERSRATNELLRNTWMNWQLSLLRLNPTAQARLQKTMEFVNSQWQEFGL